MVALSFPFTLEYQNVKATFTFVALGLNVLEQRLEITTIINAELNTQHLEVHALWTGKMEYDDFTESLIYKDPEVERFKVLSQYNSDFAPMLRIIKQSIARNLPDIPLVNFNW